MSLDDYSQDTLHRMLSHVYRRALLECLAHQGTSLTLPDAAEEVAQACMDSPLCDISDKAIKRIYMDLYHSHIPRLVDEDFVSYDQDRDVVRLTDQGEKLVTAKNQFSSSFSEN